MRPGWIDHAWEQRFNADFKANNLDVQARFELKPFTGLNIAFVNFPKEASDLKEMEDLVDKNGNFIQ